MATNGRRIDGAEILRFLDAHRLDHSPANYAFAHRFLFEADMVLRREVERITDGGVRIGPDEVAKLADVGVAATGQDNARELDRLTVRVLEIIGETVLETGDFSRELVGAAAALVRPEGFDLQSIIAAMIERTSRAETRLSDATRQAQTLRAELTALRGDAGRDPLTGLLSRQGIEGRLAGTVATRGGCAVAVIDLDGFQAINDEHGHAVGDRVLQAVAAEVAAACRPYSVARWGSEAFLILLEGLTAAEAGALVTTARDGLSLRNLKVRENDASIGTVTFSAGVATSHGRTAPELVGAAEVLLQKAKANGRGAVEIEANVVGVSARR